MSDRYQNFLSTDPVGAAIRTVIHSDPADRLVEFKAFSREGFPAVTALVSELRPLLEPLRDSDPGKFNFAKQSVGDEVAKVLRAAGYEKDAKPKSVPGKLFTVGAVWRPRA